MEPQSWAAWQAPTFLKTLSYMGGPAIAAAICLLLFRRSHDRTITLAGSSAVRSAAFYLIPIIALTLVYAPEVVAARGAPALILSLIAGSFILILGEELGWRGFLQDALRRLPKLSRYALIGVMWELWHFTNRTHEGPLVGAAIRVLIWMVILFILSWIIGEAVERSKSVVVAVTLHAWVNIPPPWGRYSTRRRRVAMRSSRLPFCCGFTCCALGRRPPPRTSLASSARQSLHHVRSPRAASVRASEAWLMLVLEFFRCCEKTLGCR